MISCLILNECFQDTESWSLYISSNSIEDMSSCYSMFIITFSTWPLSSKPSDMVCWLLEQAARMSSSTKFGWDLIVSTVHCQADLLVLHPKFVTFPKYFHGCIVFKISQWICLCWKQEDMTGRTFWVFFYKAIGVISTDVASII